MTIKISNGRNIGIPNVHEMYQNIPLQDHPKLIHTKFGFFGLKMYHLATLVKRADFFSSGLLFLLSQVKPHNKFVLAENFRYFSMNRESRTGLPDGIHIFIPKIPIFVLFWKALKWNIFGIFHVECLRIPSS
jgi:hypothetical protein